MTKKQAVVTLGQSMFRGYVSLSPSERRRRLREEAQRRVSWAAQRRNTFEGKAVQS